MAPLGHPCGGVGGMLIRDKVATLDYMYYTMVIDSHKALSMKEITHNRTIACTTRELLETGIMAIDNQSLASRIVNKCLYVRVLGGLREHATVPDLTKFFC